MNREAEILNLLEAEPEYDIFDAHIRLEEAKDLLRQDYSVDRQEDYNKILTELNFAIWEATGLTAPSDLAIAREIIRDAHTEREYREHTEGCEFSDSD